MVRIIVALLAVAVAAPAIAEPLNADAARRFVAGKLFSFTCFEGSVGSGRIFNDGSVVGMVRMQGAGPVRYMRLPSGTLFPKGEAICSQVKGAFFNPCFNLEKTSEKSFRGAISGFGFAYCDFVRRGRETMQASIAPTPGVAATAAAAAPVTRASIRRGRKAPEGKVDEKPVAAPTQPVTSAPLPPPIEQAGMRSSIAP